MLWQAQHGATAETYRKTLAERGAPIPAYLIPPDLLPGLEAWVTAFWELRTERHFAEGPIPASAIRTYPVDPAEADDFGAVMRAADAALLDFYSKPAEDRQSLPPMTSGTLKAMKHG